MMYAVLLYGCRHFFSFFCSIGRAALAKNAHLGSFLAWISARIVQITSQSRTELGTLSNSQLSRSFDLPLAAIISTCFDKRRGLSRHSILHPVSVSVTRYRVHILVLLRADISLTLLRIHES